MIKKALFALTATAVFAASAFAKDVTIPTARGEVTFKETPSKIAVFDTGSLDTLQALGVKIDGMPEFKVLSYLKPSADKAVNVGTVFEPDLEALNSLNPDLIIVGTRTAKKFDEVSQIAKTIDMTDNGDKLIESGLQRLDSFGKLFNKEAETEKLKAEINTLLD